MVFQVLAMVMWLALSASGRRRDFEGMEQRRKRAARLFARGVPQAEVARQLEVSRQSVSRWHADWERDGVNALKAAGRAGRLPRLSPAQLRRIDQALRKGPRAHGFATDLWTARRVAQVIERKWGIKFNPRYLNAWLTARDITPQKPQRVPREADQDAIERWRTHDWPRLQNGHAASGPPLHSSTNAG